MSLNAPVSKAFRPKPRAPVAPQPSVEVEKDEPASLTVIDPRTDEVAEHQDVAVEEQDEEVRIAMEMALAAAQNPHLSVDELRKLVSNKNKQVEIVEQVQQKRELEKRREREEQQKRWNQQKEKVVGWWHVKAETVVSGVSAVQKAAERKAEEIQDRYERRMYADDIQNDQQYQDIRKKCRFLQKALKAHRLQGNRVETRHSFKRQRQERKLLQLCDKIEKTQQLLTASSYNVHEYAKAMMRASRKWNKKSASDHELALEAQLCRNMHQMLALEKQKSKLKKSTREMKKYLQRCKGWLSDKKALCEMHIMTLDATHNSMAYLYQDTIARQDALIKRLKASEEFAGIDLESVELAPSWMELNMLQEHHTGGLLGPSATLAALRGLPINDSIRLRRTALEKEEIRRSPQMNDPPNAVTMDLKRPPPEYASPAGGPELYIETKDDASVSSHLSDPDEDGMDHDTVQNHQYPQIRQESFGDSDSGLGEFDKDAPWMHAASSTAGGTNSIEEEDEEPNSKYAESIIDGTPEEVEQSHASEISPSLPLSSSSSIEIDRPNEKEKELSVREPSGEEPIGLDLVAESTPDATEPVADEGAFYSQNLLSSNATESANSTERANHVVDSSDPSPGTPAPADDLENHIPLVGVELEVSEEPNKHCDDRSVSPGKDVENDELNAGAIDIDGAALNVDNETEEFIKTEPVPVRYDHQDSNVESHS